MHHLEINFYSTQIMENAENSAPSASTYLPSSRVIPTSTKPQYGGTTYKITQPTNISKFTIPGGSSKYAEPFPPINVSFQSDIRILSTLITSSNAKSIDYLQCNYASFVRIDGSSARNFFIVGFLLVQEVLAQESVENQNKEIRNYLMTSFSTLMTSIRSNPQKNSLTNLQKKLDEFLHTAITLNGGQYFDPRNKLTVARFLSEQCKIDKELAYIIAQAGRSATVKYMMSKRLDQSKYATFNKFTAEKDWGADNEYFHDIFSYFCRYSTFKVIIYTVRDDFTKEDVIGMETAVNVAYILKYSSRTKEFIGILYEGTNYSSIIKNSDVKSMLTRNKEPEINHNKEIWEYNRTARPLSP